MAGHSSPVTASPLLEGLGPERRSGEGRPEHRSGDAGAGTCAELVAEAPPSFEEVYEAWFDFVWRSARRLGVAQTHVDDVVQEVFMVVHRRLAEFEGRSQLKTWLFGITRRVVGTYHRTARRKPTEALGEREVTAVGNPEQCYAALQGQALLHALLDELAAEKREVFVLAELEEMSGPEIASALELNLNTMHARLRAARRDFEQALSRHNARARRSP
jgi:RNA polymerase sigma-70 factor (ECF subfamily)